MKTILLKLMLLSIFTLSVSVYSFEIKPIKTEINVPALSNLGQNYPNPFNPSTVISFSVNSDQFVKIKVYNTIGKEIETLVSGFLRAGNYNIEWNAKGKPSGIYFYKMESAGFVATKKMIYQK